MNFTSDNAYGMTPEIARAIVRAGAGTAPPYGDDEITKRVTARFCEIFEREVIAFPVLTGTAANALALATLSPPYGAIFCHEESHIAVDECGAPEFLTGGAKVVALAGKSAKLTAAGIEALLPRFQGGVHSVKPSVISITQATERGTVYRPGEIAEIAGLAQREGMALHMDGARFANAVAHLDCTPADISWKAGVEALSFGATKNGAFCAEAVIFFDLARARDFAYRRKRAGHLISKMRAVSAQIEAYLAKDRWLSHARRANALARQLSEALSGIAGFEIAEPVEANEVFVFAPDTIIAELRQAGAHFYDWATPQQSRLLIRLVLSCLTPECDVARFVELARASALKR